MASGSARKALLLFLASLASVHTAAGGAVGTERGGPTLRVLTLNVWHGLRSGESKMRLPGEEPERKRLRTDWQIEEIRRLDPDLLFLQEVNPNQREARRYADALGYDEIHKVTSCGIHLGPIKVPSNVNEGLAILARPELRLRRVGKKRLSGNALCAASVGFQTRESRYALFGQITLAGQPVLVVTTHLSSPPFVPPGFMDGLVDLECEGRLEPGQLAEIEAVLDHKRARNLAEVERLIAQIERRRAGLGGAAAAAPVVLGGDFNTEPDTEAIARVERAAYRNVATGPGFLTWDPLRNSANQEIGRKKAMPLPTFGIPEVEALLEPRESIARQIDYVFTTERFEPVSAELVMDRGSNGVLPSDHFGILVVLRIVGE